MFDFISGEILLFDKEENWSSFDVIAYIKPAVLDFEEKKRGIRQKIKIGHAGTLDPLATGLLVVCTGKKTKQIDQIQRLRKIYTGSFYLGATTPSYDRELPVNNQYPIDHITEDLILNTAQQFIGKQMQVPPVYSAISVGGKRSYELARQNIELELSPKLIEIYRFEIIKIELPYVYFEIECSKGTYIRAIARDFGKALNSGSYLNALRRTKIGDYDVKDALTVRQFVDILKKAKV